MRNYIFKKNHLFKLVLILASCLIYFISVAEKKSDLNIICEKSIDNKTEFLNKMNPSKNTPNNSKKPIIKKEKISKSLYFASSKEIREYQEKIKENSNKNYRSREQIYLNLSPEAKEHKNKVDRCIQS